MSLPSYNMTADGKMRGDGESKVQLFEEKRCIAEVEPSDNDLLVPLADKPRLSLEGNMASGVNTAEPTNSVEMAELTVPITTTEVTETLEPTKSNIAELPIINTEMKIGDYVSVPTDLPTSVKLATDYRCYNLTGTPHWRLQQVAWTDEYGLRRFNDDYIVGMGTYYSINIGDRFEVTYDTGKTMTVILGDNKADVLTDATHRYEPVVYWGEQCASVLEFIADLDSAPDDIWVYGTYDYLDEFKGDIVSMKYLGRDTSADWDTYY